MRNARISAWGLSLWLALGSMAAAQTAVTPGDVVSGELTDAAQVDRYTFEVAPGQRVFVQRLASSNTNQLNWTLDDAYGRRMTQALTALDHLGPLDLMGGEYALEVFSEGAGLGTYELVVHLVSDAEQPLPLEAATATTISIPGQTVRHAFTLSEPTRLFVDTVTTSNNAGLNYTLTGASGTVYQARTANLNDIGPLSLPEGAYVLAVQGEGAATGSYELALRRSELVAPEGIALDTTVAGSITQPGQVRSYTFDTPAGTEVFLDVESTTNSGGLNCRLEGASGRVALDWTGSLVDQGPWTLLEGTHTLQVRSESSGTGDFAFRVATVARPEAVAVALDTLVEGSLGTPSEVRRYTFEASDGLEVALDAVSADTTSATNWTLLGPGGHVVRNRTTAWNDGERLRLIPGEHTVVVQGEGAYTGGFAFQVLTISDAEAPIALGATGVSGTLAPGSVHRYTFTADAGRLVTIDAVSSTNTAGLNLVLRDALGRSVGARTNSWTDLGPIALVGGDYVVEVLGEDLATGDYELALVDEGTTDYTAPAGSAAELDTPFDGTITVGQEDTWSFTLTETTRVFVDLLAGAADLRWSLTDAAGTDVFGDAAARFPSGFEKGPYDLPAGAYTLEMRANNDATPAYQVVLRAVLDTTEEGSPNAPISGDITAPGQTHVIHFELPQERRVYLDLLSGDTNLYWKLDRVLADGGAAPILALTRARYPTSADQGPWTLPAGHYVLTLDPSDDHTVAPFELVLRDVTIGSGTAALGDTIAVPALAAGDGWILDVDLASASDLYLDLTAGDQQLYWTLSARDPATGENLGDVFVDAQARYPAAHDQGPYALRAGSYRLTFEAREQETDAAGLRLLEAAPTTTPIAFDQIVHIGQIVEVQLLHPAHVATYTFTLTEETPVVFDSLVAASGIYATLTDTTSGWSWFSALHVNATGDDRGPYNLPAGSYALTVRSDGESVAPFSFALWRVTDLEGGAVTPGALVTGAIPSPGGTASYEITLTSSPTPVTLDLMASNANSLRWRLLDPIGTPVFDDARAANYDQDDRGPYPLAAGTYRLVFDPNDVTAPELTFRVLTGEETYVIPEGCAKCSALDIAFLFDTSQSMEDNSTELCDLAGDLVSGLAQKGIPVSSSFWGLVDVITGPCLTTTLLEELGGDVPDPPSDDFLTLETCTDGLAGPRENWGPATAIAAARYPWTDGSVRLIVPVTDEGPYCGDGLTVLDDTAVAHAVSVALAHDVVVSPIVPDDVSDPLKVQAILVGEGTGGTSLVADFAPENLLPQVAALAAAACSTEVEAARPQLVDVSPAPALTLPAGIPLLLSGRFEAVNALRPVLDVHVAGAPAESVDSSGRFFHTIVLEPGPNAVSIMAVEGCGTFATTVSLQGEEAAEGFESWVTTAGLRPDYRDTTWSDQGQQLFTDVSAVSGADFPVDGPLIMVLGPDLDPHVALANPDGQTDAGQPYKVVLFDGETLAPGGTGGWIPLVFDDPERVAVRHSVSWLAPVNGAPVFTAAPPTRAAIDATWSYEASAFDPDGHPLTWSLVTAPPALTLAPATGALAWTPGAADIGAHDVAVSVSDGRGGTALLRFTLSVGATPANTPPLFTTPALTHAAVGATYLYDADALDLDGDPVEFELGGGPEGMSVEAENGIVSWAFALPGSHEVTLIARDGRGGEAQQRWTLTVGDISTNPYGPLITSTPTTLLAVERPWLYLVVATDPDGDSLSYQLDAAPAGALLSPEGALSWTPALADVGDHLVIVSVSDNFGGVTTQSFYLIVSDALPDEAPRFTTTPPLIAVAGAPYLYEAAAEDPEGGAVALTLAGGPASADLAAGTLSWTPEAGDAGLVALALQATDEGGLVAAQSWIVNVRESNSAPVISAGPVSTEAPIGGTFTWAVSATDADGDALTFSLDVQPPGMTIHATTGVVTWSPQASDEGTAELTVRASDPWGGSGALAVTLTVTLDSQPPEVVISTSLGVVCPGERFQVCVAASDDRGVASKALSVDGAPVVLTGGQCADLETDGVQVGVAFALVATASDTSGNVGSAALEVPVIDCAANEPPVVTIVSPVPDASISGGHVELVATITDDQPAALTWEVTLAPAGAADDTFEVIGSGSGEVDQGVVAAFDPTLLADGLYAVRVLGNDGAETGGVEVRYALVGGYKPGRYSFTVVDLVAVLGGLPHALTRSYDSLDAAAGAGGDFGPGWRLGIGGEVTDSPAEAEASAALGGLAALTAEAFTRTSRVVVTRPDGRRAGFTFAPVAQGFPLVTHVAPYFEPDPGVTDRLEAAGPSLISDFGGRFYEFVFPYNPSVYTLVTREGLRYRIDESAGLLSVEDVAGNTTEVTPAGLVHSSGAVIAIVRDAEGRITALSEPEPVDGGAAPTWTYEYDGAGNLEVARDPGGVETRYAYEIPGYPHYVSAIEDGSGQALWRNVYDADGRLVAQCDGDGDLETLVGCLTLEVDAAAGVQTIVDADGFVTERFADADGNEVLERHWGPSGERLDFAQDYDADGNVVSAVMPGADSYTYAYDGAGQLMSVTDPGGGTWSWSYGACDAPELTTDPLGNQSFVAYDASCAMEAVTDELGNRLELVYGNGGRVDALVNALDERWTLAYEAADGSLSSLTDPRGSVRQVSYAGEDLGRVIDRDGRRIDWTYDDARRLVRETWIGPAGEELYAIDFAWDAAGRLTSATAPDQSLTVTWWPTGRLRRLTHAGLVAYWVELDYDGRGYPTLITDSFGGVQARAYDFLGRLSSIAHTGDGVDPKRVDIIYGDGVPPLRIERRSSAEPDGPLVATTDYSYDCGACGPAPTAIVHRDGAGQDLHTLSFDRDALGRITALDDAAGAHSYVYDGSGRLISADHAEASGLPDESYTYDAAGNRTASHLAASYSYGIGGRLASDGAHAYAYDARGNLTSMTATADGALTELAYDPRNRLQRLTRYDGAGAVVGETTWAYDLFGNPAVVTEDGVERRLAYVGLHPLAELDAAGGVTARWLYADGLDRLLAEERGGASRWMLSDHVGTVRDVVDVGGAPVVSYRYDSFGQLLATLPADGSGYAAPVGFQGRPRLDSSGLIDFRLRWYAPWLGRFLSEDPLPRFDYPFAANDPLGRTDPLGLSTGPEYGVLQKKEPPQIPVKQRVACAISKVLFYTALAAKIVLIKGGSPVNIPPMPRFPTSCVAGPPPGPPYGPPWNPKTWPPMEPPPWPPNIPGWPGPGVF